MLPSGTDPFRASSMLCSSSTSLNSSSAVLPMRFFARAASLMPGSWTMIRSSPCGMISGSVMPNWSTRLRMVSRLCSTASFLMSTTRLSRIFRPTVSRPSEMREDWTSRSGYWSLRIFSKAPLAALSASSREMVFSFVRSMFRKRTLLSMRVSFMSLAIRSIAASTALSAWTSRTRCMPPCRSRPR